MTSPSPAELRQGASSDSPDRPSSSLHLPEEGLLIARALVRLRGDRSRAEVARKAGVDEAAWKHYESGRRSFTPEQRVPLARGLGVTVYELEHTLWRERAAELRKLEGDALAPLSEPFLTSAEGLSKCQLLIEGVDRIAAGVKQLITAYFSHFTEAAPGDRREES